VFKRSSFSSLFLLLLLCQTLKAAKESLCVMEKMEEFCSFKRKQTKEKFVILL